jgi:hypothetical protein
MDFWSCFNFCLCKFRESLSDGFLLASIPSCGTICLKSDLYKYDCKSEIHKDRIYSYLIEEF